MLSIAIVTFCNLLVMIDVGDRYSEQPRQWASSSNSSSSQSNQYRYDEDKRFDSDTTQPFRDEPEASTTAT